MTIYHNSLQELHAFQKYTELPAGSPLAGYSALIANHNLKVPPPDYLCAIGRKHKKELVSRWQIFTPRHRPDDSLIGHLTFALKYEGVNLIVLKSLFLSLKDEQIIHIVLSHPTSSYSRRVWFLYEWLLETKLDIPNATHGSYVELVNANLQYAGPTRNSKRHRIKNNLPGNLGFCPMVRRTEKLEAYLKLNLNETAEEVSLNTRTDLLRRATDYLQFEDSKASYLIENEAPPQPRIKRWEGIIRNAGKDNLSIKKLEEMQSIVLADHRFIHKGCRAEGGFIGRHDRKTRIPIPVHISARHQDLESLLSSLIETNELLKDSQFDAVIAAAIIAFGFVFIHPFADGNGRIHRYLFNHVLAEKRFSRKNLTIPISYVILDRLQEYLQTLEHYSTRILNLIEWKVTESYNVEILNETIDLYRYFDATNQAEFLFDCVAEALNEVLPQEIDYLVRYDQLYRVILDKFDMSDKDLSLLVIFLNQNNGKLSKRARKKEFSKFSDQEANWIEEKYEENFGS